jgi:hypothetical protein
MVHIESKTRIIAPFRRLLDDVIVLFGGRIKRKRARSKWKRAREQAFTGVESVKDALDALESWIQRVKRAFY